MAQDVAAAGPERRVLAHVQVRAANAAAADLDDHLAFLRRRIGNGLERERLVERLEDGCLHLLKLPSATPPSIRT
jgi:hypothetical protein